VLFLAQPYQGAWMITAHKNLVVVTEIKAGLYAGPAGFLVKEALAQVPGA
jgi:hypothetical protein